MKRIALLIVVVIAVVVAYVVGFTANRTTEPVDVVTTSTYEPKPEAVKQPEVKQPAPKQTPVKSLPSTRPEYSYGQGVSVPECLYGSNGQCLIPSTPELAQWSEQQQWNPAPTVPSSPYGGTYSNPADCTDPKPWVVILSSGYDLTWTAMCAQELEATVGAYIAGWTDDYGYPVFIVDYFEI